MEREFCLNFAKSLDKRRKILYNINRSATRHEPRKGSKTHFFEPGEAFFENFRKFVRKVVRFLAVFESIYTERK